MPVIDYNYNDVVILEINAGTVDAKVKCPFNFDEVLRMKMWECASSCLF